MRFAHSVLLMALLTSATAAAHADNVYSFNLNSNGATAVGTITTDGTIGVLQSNNILSYSFTLSDGSTTAKIENGIFYIVGNDLSATSTDLIYNFTDTTTLNYAGFAGVDYSSFLCFTGSANCGGTTGAQTDIKLQSNYYLTNQTGVQALSIASLSSQTGSQPSSIGTSIAQTPEPSSLALLGTGMLGLYGAARRRFV